ncbi:MAG: DUF1049 domain-containing protein [Rhizobiales bacterium]|nr:DUF1049 domain-containing protein [Hyphomicrobiales bacterium]
MKRFLSWALGLPVAIILIAFAIANRKSQTVSFDPFSQDAPWLSFDIPLWSLFFAGIFVGLFAGGIAAWLKQGKWRKIARRHRAELDSLRIENERLKQQLSRSDKLLASQEKDVAA